MAFQSSCIISLLAPVPTTRAKPLRAAGSINTRLMASSTSQVTCCATRPTITAATHATSSGSSCTKRTANYQPNLWDYQSIQHQDTESSTHYLDEVNVTLIFEKLKEEVKQFLVKETELLAQLELVDALQHLGLAYHFEEEIKNLFGSISIEIARTSLAHDLHSTSLLFRLFRENGLHVSQDMFSTFKDDEGRFKEWIYNNPRGILSLYEASHLAFEGEDMLEEARLITTKHLHELKLNANIDPQLKERVERALELPLHWRSPRLDVKWHIQHYYQNDEQVSPVLLQLAVLDFNMVQNIHQAELKRMTRWWIDLGITDKLYFARDRLVECFLFAAGVVPQPNLGHCREEITKVCNMITTLDDAYDIYGSQEDLELFTEAVNRWEFGEMRRLPDTLKICYAVVYNTTSEIVKNILLKDGRDVLPYLRKTWADLCVSFLVEAKWHSSGYFPTLEEYLDNGWKSASGHVLILHVFGLSRQTSEIMHCLASYPDFIRSSSIILRLCNDLATSTAETERGDAPSSILCYMHEHGVTEKVAREEIKKLIHDTWKKLNKEVADCNSFPRPLVSAAINLARTSHSTYHNGDGIGAPDQKRKNQIKSTFFEPITVRGNSPGYVDNKLVT